VAKAIAEGRTVDAQAVLLQAAQVRARARAAHPALFHPHMCLEALHY
jgi:hypothetical protein